MLRIVTTGMPQAAVAFMKSTPTASFGDLKSSTDFRDTLRRDQHGLCAYCEANLPDHDQGASGGGAGTKIEHFHAQRAPWGAACSAESGAPDLESSPVTWDNLLLVCPDDALGSTKTCDTKKGNTDVCGILHNPKRRPPTELTQVSVAADGTVTARNGRADAQQALDATLNLNAEPLRTARREVWAQLVTALAVNMPASSANLIKVHSFLEQSAMTNAFGSVYLSLADELKAQGVVP